ncbi:MAG: hypothetical protein IJU62_09865 [Muribaculaceae bacterium]|nr:hypothetical protein [Muribaculaceae bacterium]
MATAVINIHVTVPQSYSLDLLQEQLTAYAQRLVSMDVPAHPVKTPKRHYRHESLCGILSSHSDAEHLIEEYITEKYNLVSEPQQ